MQTSGSTTTTTTYYSVGGQRVAANVNGTLYYFGYDALGSQVAVFNNSGNLIGSQLYGPYGNQRYANGSLPTSIGFMGQQADSTTGLDYYGARYYDPVTGQFLSADTVQGNAQGANPYSYVGGNPESRIDPTGHKADFCDCSGIGEVDASGGDDDAGGRSDVGSNNPDFTPADGSVNVDTWVDTEGLSNVTETPEQTLAQEESAYREAQAQSHAKAQDPNATSNDTTNTDDGNNADNGNGHPPLFRGTSPDFPGGTSAQRLGVTFTSTDPAVATAFATNAATMYGEGVVHIALPGDLEGVEITEGNVLANLEQEVGVWITPTDFADRASITISADTARSILGDLGIDVPGRISLGNLSNTIRDLPSLSSEQIGIFIQRAIESL